MSKAKIETVTRRVFYGASMAQTGVVQINLPMPTAFAIDMTGQDETKPRSLPIRGDANWRDKESRKSSPMYGVAQSREVAEKVRASRIPRGQDVDVSTVPLDILFGSNK